MVLAAGKACISGLPAVVCAQPGLTTQHALCCAVLLTLLQVLAQAEEGSAHELAFSMLLSLALIPAAQQLVADQGEIKQLVQVRQITVALSSGTVEGAQAQKH